MVPSTFSLQGWCVNLNGLTGLLVATAKGLIHSLPVASHLNADIVPVDFVTNGVIAAGWKTGISGRNITKPLGSSDGKCFKRELKSRNLISLFYFSPLVKKTKLPLQRLKSLPAMLFIQSQKCNLSP